MTDASLRGATASVVSRRLRALARDARGFDAARYFRGTPDLRFHNVGTAAVRNLARAIVVANGTWTISEAMALADALMTDPYLEAKAVGIEVVGRYRRQFAAPLLPRWKRWLARELAANWATTDLLCGTLIGPLLVRDASLIVDVCAWHTHRVMWVRRASAVALLPAIRRGLVLEAGYDVAAALHGESHDLMHKAVGWLLRELGKRDAARLEAYLRAHGPSMPRTTVRYAIERFPAAARAELLAVTRAPRAAHR